MKKDEPLLEEATKLEEEKKQLELQGVKEKRSAGKLSPETKEKIEKLKARLKEIDNEIKETLPKPNEPLTHAIENAVWADYPESIREGVMEMFRERLRQSIEDSEIREIVEDDRSSLDSGFEVSDSLSEISISDSDKEHSPKGRFQSFNS